MKYQFLAIAGGYAGSFGYLYMQRKDHLPLHKYLSNHVLLFAPLNFIFTFFTVGRQSAVFATRTVPGLDRLKANYPIIREEAQAMLDAGVFHRPPSVDQP